MSQALARSAASHASHPSPSVALDAYLDHSFARFEAIVVACVPGLAEPRTDDPRTAFRLVARMTETLAGFAVGTTVGTLASALKRAAGSSIGAAVDAELARIVRGGPRPAVEWPFHVPPFFANAIVRGEKPLADELGAKLLVRLRLSLADARRHVTALARASGDSPVLAPTLELLTPDDTPALAFTDQLTVAWQTLRSRLGAKPTGAPLSDASARFARARATWHHFSVTDAGAPAPLTTHEEIVAAGFLMRIG